MRRILIAALAGVLPALPGLPAGLPAPAAPGLHAPARALGAPAATPAGGRHRQSPSTALAMGLRGLDEIGGDGDADGGVRDAFPGTGLPRAPATMPPDVIVNQDRSAMPHNETSVAINPRNPLNVLVGANDYSLGFGSSGFYASFDGGQSFYGGVLPLPSVTFTPPLPALPDPIPPVPTTPIALDGGGDPAVAFDRDGVAYYAEINFHRTGCVSGIFVLRSSNGGQTWSRPLSGRPQKGDSRQSGDGVVAVNANDHNCQIFYDKEYIATGPRPAAVAIDPHADLAHLSSDRLYIVYSEFGALPPLGIAPYLAPVVGTGSPTFLSHSDDQGRHWSTPVYVDGASARFCTGGGLPAAGLPGVGGLPVPLPGLPAPSPPVGVGLPPSPPRIDPCNSSQGAQPAVDPRTGAVYVVFNNGDDAACPNGQVMVSASFDGGDTWTEEPSQAACLVSPLPQAGERACPQEPAGQEVLSGYCFRVPSATQQSVAVSPIDGSVHVVYEDNRGGKDWDPGLPGAKPSDVDIFTVASHDGARTWGAAVRVNQDPPGNRRDQFFPWGAIGPDGTLYVAFLDRSLDPGGGPPGAGFQLRSPGGRLIGRSLAVSRDGGATFRSRAISTGLFDGNLAFRQGSFLGDYTGIAAGALGAYTAWPDTRRAGAYVKGDNPVDMWSDIVGYASVPGDPEPRAAATGAGPGDRPPAGAGGTPAPPLAATVYGPDPQSPAAGSAARIPAPAGMDMADVLGGFLCGMVVMALSSLRRRRGGGG